MMVVGWWRLMLALFFFFFIMNVESSLLLRGEESLGRSNKRADVREFYNKQIGYKATVTVYIYTITVEILHMNNVIDPLIGSF